MRVYILFLSTMLALYACEPISAPTSPDVSSDGLAREYMVEDIRVFRREIIELDASFSEQQGYEAIEALGELEDREGLTKAEFALELARIAALAENAHTGLLFVPIALEFPRLDLRFYTASDGTYVVDSTSEFTDLRGAKLKSVGGVDVKDLRWRFENYSSGSSGFREQSFLYLLESPALLSGLGIKAEDDSVTMEFAGGRSVRVSSGGIDDEPIGVWRLLPQAREIDFYQRGLISGNPVYLTDPLAPIRLIEIVPSEVVFVQFRSNVDFNGNIDMAEESKHILRKLQQMQPRAIIVDQRFNVGGDLTTTRELMQAIPTLIPKDGKLAAIVSGRTFSAGITSLAYLEQASDGDLFIVGTPIGDSLEFYAEGGDPIVLPRSGLVFLRGLERHNYRDGCPEDDCHINIQIDPISINELEPDSSPAFTYTDLVAGKDPYLREALRHVSD